MSADVVARIFKEFKFRTITPSSSKNLIYKTIVNTAFGANIICSIMDSDKHVNWFVNDAFVDVLIPLQEACKMVPVKGLCLIEEAIEVDE